jgi:hypothetical protein
MLKFLSGPLKAKRCFKQYGCDDPIHCGARITGPCEWLTLQDRLRPKDEEVAF